MPPAPGITPSRISGCPTVPSSARYRRSAARASSNPPPSANPLIAAIDTFGHDLQLVERIAERGHHGPDLVRPEVRHGLDVRTGREDLRTTPHDHGPHIVASRGLREGLLQLQTRLKVERVRRRAVQTHHTDAVVDLEPHELPHDPPSLPTGRRGPLHGEPESGLQRREGDTELRGGIRCVRTRRCREVLDRRSETGTPSARGSAAPQPERA